MKPIINAIKYWTNSRIEESQINLDKKINDINVEFNSKIEESQINLDKKINDANIEFNRKIEESKADWDEKDSNVNSYIKNKTHYLHKNQEIFNQTLSLDEYCNYSTSLPLSSNKNYLVTINQIEFITTAVYLETETALEPELVHEGIYWGYIDNYGIYLNRPTFKPNQEIQISICEIEFKPIDKKYLSNCMTETNPVGTGTFNFNGSQSTQQGYNSFIIGQGSFTKGNDSFIAGEYLYNYNKNNSILGKNNANNSHVITKAIDKTNILNGKNSTYGYKISNITPDYSRGVFFIDVDYTPISYQSVQLNIPYIMYLPNIIDIEGRTAVRFYAIPTSKKSNYNSAFYSINYDEVSMISED
jgi:hypothetical protein